MDTREMLLAMLRAMQRCYVERNPDSAGPLCGLLFDPADPPVVIGTSDGEWCFGIDEAKKLFTSDWEGWGDVWLDMPGLICGTSGQWAWFHVPAGVEYRFEDTPERYRSYLEAVERIAEGGKPALAKSSEIIWLLSHLLHTRERSRRRYLWNMSLSGIVKCGHGAGKVKTMQFSMPAPSAFPDVRIDVRDNEDAIPREGPAQGSFNARQDDGRLRLRLERLLDADSGVIWAGGGSQQFVGTDGTRRTGKEFSEYIGALARDCRAEFPARFIIAGQSGGFFYFCGKGVLHRAVSLEKELDSVLSSIRRHADETDPKEALFRIRRDLALVIKEASLPGRYSAPFRMEGVGEWIGDGAIRMDYAQLSYPFNWVLEQKNEAQHEIAADT